MTQEGAKDYLYSKEIPRVFECIIGAMMHHQPANPISFARDCFADLHNKGNLDSLEWSTFIEEPPQPASAGKLEAAMSGWMPIAQQRGNTLPLLAPTKDIIRDSRGIIRPMICVNGADRDQVQSISSKLLKQFDFFHRNIGKEPRAMDVSLKFLNFSFISTRFSRLLLALRLLPIGLKSSVNNRQHVPVTSFLNTQLPNPI